MRLMVIFCAAAALSSCHKAAQQAPEQAPATASQTQQKGVDRTHAGTAAPASAFTNPDGSGTSLKALTGKPTLVNLWASWCAPCIKELPTLDALARSNGSLRVVAVSEDMAPHASVEAFLKLHKIRTLASYQDPKMALSGALDAEVLPTSILYDSHGKEVWRYVGDQDWTSPAAAKLLEEATRETRS